jgi:hypothetical protein
MRHCLLISLLLASFVSSGCGRVADTKDSLPARNVEADLAGEGKSKVKINHPLLEKLRKADQAAAMRFPDDDFDGGFGRLGLLFHSSLVRSDYWCTPKNVVTFASTGGNGVHFSLLVRDGKVTEASPVVVTIPSPGDQPNYIVGENLHDFLCLGVHRGYFALEQLPSSRLFEAYGSADWKPGTDADMAVGFGVDPQQRQLLDFLKEELKLEPWKDVRKKFDRLQKTYLPLLEMP